MDECYHKLYAVPHPSSESSTGSATAYRYIYIYMFAFITRYINTVPHPSSESSTGSAIVFIDLVLRSQIDAALLCAQKAQWPDNVAYMRDNSTERASL